jgi:hypothetical protein
MNLNCLFSRAPKALAIHRGRIGRTILPRPILTALTLFALILSSCLPSARAQVSASITGVVTDSSGAPVLQPQ